MKSIFTRSDCEEIARAIVLLKLGMDSVSVASVSIGQSEYIPVTVESTSDSSVSSENIHRMIQSEEFILHE